MLGALGTSRSPHTLRLGGLLVMTLSSRSPSKSHSEASAEWTHVTWEIQEEEQAVVALSTVFLSS